jgi:DNA-binding GntR family transcriptional regulator
MAGKARSTPASDLSTSALATSAASLLKTVDGVRTSSGDQVALYIRWLIFDGVLPPGSRVPQDEIAQQLGVSRIPVREALIALEREGWVTIELHRGAFINTLDEDDVRDHYELYGRVYGFAAQRAIARSSRSELVESLEEIVKKLSQAHEPDDFTQLALEFHRTVINAAHSHRIKVVIRAMSRLVPGDFFSLVPEAMAIERRGLPRITRALADADGDRAADEYLSMMKKVGEKVVAVFKARGLFDMPADDAPVPRRPRKPRASKASRT